MLIEGKFNVNDHCIIIEDIVTSGSSIIETANVKIRNQYKNCDNE